MVVVRAPVRISFGGGGTDLAAYYDRFGGLVLSAAITRYAYVLAQTPADGRISLSSADYKLWDTWPKGHLPTIEEPLALPKAALAASAGRGLRGKGVELFLAAEVPPGTGLGSSSAMAVALVRALAAYTGEDLDPAEAAERACDLEIKRLGMPIGKQDQYASAFGGLNTIAFTRDGVTVTPLPVSRDLFAQLGCRLLLFSTGQTREASSILHQQRSDTQSNSGVLDRLHRLKALAVEMREALLAGNLDGFGTLLDRSWQEKRQLSGKVSSAAIDAWYDAARSAGALGGKITGAGGGGYLLLYVPQRKQRAVRAALTSRGLREMPFEIALAGAQVLSGLPEEHPFSHHVDFLPVEGVAPARSRQPELPQPGWWRVMGKDETTYA